MINITIEDLFADCPLHPHSLDYARVSFEKNEIICTCYDYEETVINDLIHPIYYRKSVLKIFDFYFDFHFKTFDDVDKIYVRQNEVTLVYEENMVFDYDCEIEELVDMLLFR